jgi:hypothetical protein
MHYENADFIEPALDVIAKTDPELYARMKASDWKVYAPETGLELAAEPVSTMVKYNIMMILDSALGITLPRDPEIPEDAWHSTWLNRASIEDQARYEGGVPADEYAAFVMAHEFSHIEGGNEDAARTEGSRFARLEHEPSLVTLSETDRYRVDDHGVPLRSNF